MNGVLILCATLGGRIVLYCCCSRQSDRGFCTCRIHGSGEVCRRPVVSVSRWLQHTPFQRKYLAAGVSEAPWTRRNPPTLGHPACLWSTRLETSLSQGFRSTSQCQICAWTPLESTACPRWRWLCHDRLPFWVTWPSWPQSLLNHRFRWVRAWPGSVQCLLCMLRNRGHLQVEGLAPRAQWRLGPPYLILKL